MATLRELKGRIGSVASTGKITGAMKMISSAKMHKYEQALKRLANTMYGVYGFLRFRWYSFECAQSITAWGRQHIKKAMKEAEDYGFKAIYADTDGFYAKYVPEMKKE